MGVMGFAAMAVVFGGVFLYWKLFGNKMGGKYTAAHDEAVAEFEANKEQIIGEYLTDKDRFGLFKDVIEDETILGIASYLEPKSLGKSALEGLKTEITRVKKVNLALFYLVVTDNNLHAIVSNGDNTIDHTVFALKDLKNVSANKAGGLNVMDKAKGIDGNFTKLKFDCNGNSFDYNIYQQFIIGYPRFRPYQNKTMNEVGREYFAPGGQMQASDLTSKDGQLAIIVREKFLTGFREQMKKATGVEFPA